MQYGPEYSFTWRKQITRGEKTYEVTSMHNRISRPPRMHEFIKLTARASPFRMVEEVHYRWRMSEQKSRNSIADIELQNNGLFLIRSFQLKRFARRSHQTLESAINHIADSLMDHRARENHNKSDNPKPER